MTTATELPLAELQQLEDAVRKSDGDGLRARYESGRFMNTLKKGKKQLPKGTLAELARKLGVARSEINARMKFAAEYPTEAKLTDVIRKFPTWHAITHGALTNTPRAPKTGADEADCHARRDLQHATEIIENTDAALLGEVDQELIVRLTNAVRRLKESVVFLKEAA